MCMCAFVFAGDTMYVKQQCVLWVLEGGIILNKNNGIGEKKGKSHPLKPT